MSGADGSTTGRPFSASSRTSVARFRSYVWICSPGWLCLRDTSHEWVHVDANARNADLLSRDDGRPRTTEGSGTRCAPDSSMTDAAQSAENPALYRNQRCTGKRMLSTKVVVLATRVGVTTSNGSIGWLTTNLSSQRAKKAPPCVGCSNYESAPTVWKPHPRNPAGALMNGGLVPARHTC